MTITNIIINICIVASALAAAPLYEVVRSPAYGAYAWRSGAHLNTFHIVMPEDASPALHSAGEAFHRLWTAAMRRPIGISHINAGHTNVWLGAELVADDLLSPQTIASLAKEEYLIRTYTPSDQAAARGVEKQLMIVGGSDEAVLHGVYAFFGQVLNVRWLAPGITDFGTPLAALRELNIRGRPEFSMREIAPISLWQAEALEFRRAYGLSEIMLDAPGACGYFDAMGETAAGEASHQYPAYGAYEGARLVLNHILDMARAGDRPDNETLLERRRAALWELSDASVWRLAAMDWLQPVLAPEGRALNEREGSPAAAVIALANEVAAGLANALPGENHWVHVLLSPAMQTPPATLRPHPHVLVQLTTKACNFAVPLSDRQCPINSRFVAELAGWNAVGARVLVLDHLANMRAPGMPFPHFDTVQPNLHVYARYRVAGVYYAGLDAADAAEVDLSALRLYLSAVLLDNPDLIVEACIEDFLNRYYGTAADEVSQYLALSKQAVAAHGQPLLSDDDGAWLSAEFLSAAQGLMRQALERTLSDEIRGRVEEIADGLARVHKAREE